MAHLLPSTPGRVHLPPCLSPVLIDLVQSSQLLLPVLLTVYNQQLAADWQRNYITANNTVLKFALRISYETDNNRYG